MLFINSPGAAPAYNVGAQDVRADEIAVANISDLAYMPAIYYPWGVSDAFTGFVDRIANVDRLVNGLADVRTQFSARNASERPTYKTIGNTHKPISSLDTSGSFTLAYAVCCEQPASNWGISIGCPTIPSGAESYWFLLSDAAGKIRVGTGAASTAFVDYAGPAVGNYWTRILFEYDRTGGQIRVYVDGGLHVSLSHASVTSGVYPAGVIFGSFSNLAATTPVNQRILSPLAWPRLLTAGELTIVDTFHTADIAALAV